MALKPIHHEALKLIMKHEDIFNSLEPNHNKLRAIEAKLESMGLSLCALDVKYGNYGIAITWIANHLVTNWFISDPWCHVEPQNTPVSASADSDE